RLDRFQHAKHEAKTIGIVLWSEKNDAMVKISLPENDEQLLPPRYQMSSPGEEQLRDDGERVATERALHMREGGRSS
ncbi:MAG TPA: hypothetical protein VM580_12140, partial [Labilithrix sp.]|nr:hypothetical protein [Labilithrix sp.]